PSSMMRSLVCLLLLLSPSSPFAPLPLPRSKPPAPPAPLSASSAPPSASSAAPSAAAPSAAAVDTLVIGSGVTGSTLAFHLSRNHGRSVLLAERNAAVGGNCISSLVSVPGAGDFVFDQGPNSAQPTPAIMRTCYELGLNDDIILADGSLPRFVYWRGDGAGRKPGDLHALPTNLPGDLLTFQLLSWPGRLRAAAGAAGLIAPPPEGKKESVADFVTRHLGKEAFERIIAPFCSGVYAGDPEKLCMSAGLKKIFRLEGLGELGPGLVSGALVRMREIGDERRENPPDPRWKTYEGGQLMSFKRGLQTLPDAVAKHLGEDKIRTAHTLVSLTKDASSDLFHATFEVGDGKEEAVIKARTVALTSPAPATARVLGGSGNLVPAAERLKEIYQPPVAAVVLAYPNHMFKEDLPGYTAGNPLRGFGILF
ncbi:hypothetical protein TeGR_g11698, partial [Tetraparma gracilis]